MKNITEVDALLAKRQAYAKRNPGCRWWGAGLELRQGDRLNAYGWALREVGETPGLGGLDLTTDDKLALLREYWFGEWNRQEAQAKAEERELKRKATTARLRAQWADFGPPGRFGRLLPGSYRIDTDEQRAALEKVSAFPSASMDAYETEFSTLALVGTPGTGKTHLAALWLREQVFEQEFAGQFITAAQLVREVRRAWDERGVDETQVLERFGTVECLVIDDVGVDTSEGAVRMLVEVLDMRLAHELPTCITSNATPTQLKEIFGPRGFSRLMANAQIVALVGEDRRLARPDVQKKTNTEVNP